MKNVVLGLVLSLALALNSLYAVEVYAVVNGENITKEDIDLVLKGQNVKFDSLSKDIQKKVIEQIIDKKLLASNAISNGIEKTDIFQKSKQDLALQIWIQEEFKKIKVSDKEKKNYYNKNKSEFKQEETLEARHILVKKEKEAITLIKELDSAKDKKEKFIELAKDKSTGPTGKSGGYLGSFTASQMVKEFSDAASALKVGEYTKKPVKTRFGYHIILLESKQAEKTKEFNDVQESITKQISEEKFTTMITNLREKLRKKAKIVIK